MLNNNILPKISKKPYYIYSPAYRASSAGIKSLYLLCHHLNSRGYDAYIYPDSEYVVDPNLYDDIFYSLNIRFLDNDVIEFHKKAKYEPIAIYTDTVSGNPINAKFVVRYMMNYKGRLNNISVDENEIQFAYSKKISDSLGLQDDRVLFILPVNFDLFHPPKNKQKRSGSCVYLGKYYDHHKGKEFDITKESTKIARHESHKDFDILDKIKIANLLRESELCYVYENTAIAVEAVLCGCPAVFIPNDFLKEDEVHLSRNELGIDGFALNCSKEEISRAKETVDKGRENCLKSCEIFYDQLDNFIKNTYGHFSLQKQEGVNEISYIKKNITLMDYLNIDVKSRSESKILDPELFENELMHIKKLFPFGKVVRKIKLGNSHKRIIITTKISIRGFNIGGRVSGAIKRIISSVLKKNSNNN